MRAAWYHDSLQIRMDMQIPFGHYTYIPTVFVFTSIVESYYAAYSHVSVWYTPIIRKYYCSLYIYILGTYVRAPCRKSWVPIRAIFPLPRRPSTVRDNRKTIPGTYYMYSYIHTKQTTHSSQLVCIFACEGIILISLFCTRTANNSIVHTDDTTVFLRTA